VSRKSLTPIVLPADPAAAMEAATKQYVDTAVAGANAIGAVTGDVKMSLSTTADPGWVVLDGSTISTSGATAALAAKIGTKWNTGGETAGTVRLPDTRRRFPWGHTSGSAAVLGYTDGVVDPFSRSPQHDHGGNAGTSGSNHQHSIDVNGNNITPTGGTQAKVTAVGGVGSGTGTTQGTSTHTHNISAALQTGSTDGTLAFPNFVVVFMAKL